VDGIDSRRAVVIISIAAGVLVIIHGVLWDVARYEGGSLLARPADLVTIGDGKAAIFRVSLVADMLGSYLMLVPAAVYLWRELRERDGLAVDIATASGVMYSVMGASAAAALAGGGEPLIRAYDGGSATEAAQAAISFEALIGGAVSVWQISGAIAGGVWWLIIGALLRDRWKWFARFSMAFGAFLVLFALARALGLEVESSGPATLAFAPIGVWAIWFGANVWSAPQRP
jgi:hypothetical protein